MTEASIRTAWQGRFIEVVTRGGWEFVRRRSVGVVGIVALTDRGALVLIEQVRPPLNCPVIELPAGLVGDAADNHDESPLVAAQRELIEETGFEAARIEPLANGASSAGLTDELIELVLARGLKKVAAGGGVDDEQISVHEVPLREVPDWLASQQRQGKQVDLKVYAALWFAEQATAQRTLRTPQ